MKGKTMTAMTATKEKQVTRPLKVLVPLIKEDLKRGSEAAQSAGMPYYKSAGEKLNEARNGQNLTLREICDWSKKNFGLARTQTILYMSYDTATSDLSVPERTPFKSLDDFKRRHLGHKVVPGSQRDTWRDDVKANVDRARREAERISQEDLNRKQEREAETQLALRLIDIGYKVLAKELHPDKGGSRDAMQRLSKVRDRLKASA